MKELKGVFEHNGEVLRFRLCVDGDDVSLWISGELHDAVMSWGDVRDWHGTPRTYWVDLDDYRTGQPKSVSAYFGVGDG
jgi:hypothetical protein